MYIYHYKSHVTEHPFFQFLSCVSLQKEYICINKHICKKAMLYHWPSLPKSSCRPFPSWLPVSSGSQRTCTTFLGGRKPHGTIRWSRTKYQVTAEGHVCWTIHKPCAGNFLCKTLTRAIIQKQPNSLSAQAMGGVLWRVTDGLHWLSSHGSPCCLRLAVFSCLKMWLCYFPYDSHRSSSLTLGPPPQSISKTLHPTLIPFQPTQVTFSCSYPLPTFLLGYSSLSYWFVSVLCILKESVLYLPHLLVIFSQYLSLNFINSVLFIYSAVLNFY